MKTVVLIALMLEQTSDIPENLGGRKYVKTLRYSSMLDSLDIDSLTSNLFFDELANSDVSMMTQNILRASQVAILNHEYPSLSDAHKFYRLTAQNRALMELLKMIYFESISDDHLKSQRANKIKSCIAEKIKNGGITASDLKQCYGASGLQFNRAEGASKSASLTDDIISALGIEDSPLVGQIDQLVDHASTYNNHVGIYLNGQRLIKYFIKSFDDMSNQWISAVSKYQTSGSITPSELRSLGKYYNSDISETDIRMLSALEDTAAKKVIGTVAMIQAYAAASSAYENVMVALAKYNTIPHTDSFIKSFVRGQQRSLESQMRYINTFMRNLDRAAKSYNDTSKSIANYINTHFAKYINDAKLLRK